MHRRVRERLYAGLGLMSISALIGCGSDAPLAGREHALGEVTGALSVSAEGPGSLHDVISIHYEIVSAASECGTEPILETTVALEAETLPDSVNPVEGAGAHEFTDALFVLAPGDYRICATPMAAEGVSARCAPVDSVATVVAEETTEVVLASMCEGDPNGGLDVVVALNEPPSVNDLTIEPSKFITTCETATISVVADDPEGDALTYTWEVSAAPEGSAPTLVGDGDAASFAGNTAGDYEVTLTVTDVYGAAVTLSFPFHVTGSPCFTAYTFEVTGTGASGTIQTFTVPASGTYRLEVWGAQGASPASTGRVGGRGARMRGDFALSGGDVLQVLVGQAGVAADGNGGGGGGTFIVKSDGTPLIIAGGGGGTRAEAIVDGFDAVVTPDGVAGVVSSDGSPGTLCAGGTAGLGGGFCYSWGSGGGGLLGDGQNDNGYGTELGTGGLAFINGGIGGSSTYACGGLAEGGFGGGGAGNGCWGGGGGGGYSGGGGGFIAGGGGSYNAGSNQSNADGANTGNGLAVITLL